MSPTFGPVHAEIAHRADALRRASRSERAAPAETARVHVEALLDAVAVELDGLDALGLREALRRVVAAERLLRVVVELKAQERLVDAELLAFARQAAREGYRHVRRAARALGVRGEPGGTWPEPLVLLEPMATPATYVRGARHRPLGLTGGAESGLPFPLVLLPWYPRTSLGSLCVVHHEIGHNLDEDLGLTDAAASKVRACLLAAGADPRDADTWAGWTAEAVADVFAVLLGGVAFAIEMAAWASALGDDDLVASLTHPPPAVRVTLAVALLERLGVSLDAPLAEATRVAASASSAYLAHVGAVADALLDAPLAALGLGTLRDLAPAVDREHTLVVRVATAIAAIADRSTLPEDLDAVPLRLVPSVARVAVALGVPAEALANALFAHANRRSEEDGAPFRATSFAQSLRWVRAPILDEEQGGIKRAPPELFATARRVSFLGGTNDSLPTLLRDHAARQLAPKESLDVFFLTDHAIGGLASPTRDAAETRRLRTQVLSELTPDLLDAVARRWRIFEHDEPYFFASYWDADAPGGRVHMSWHGWGQDIQRTPSRDEVWPAGAREPPATYKWFLDAREGLAGRARRVAESG